MENPLKSIQTRVSTMEKYGKPRRFPHRIVAVRAFKGWDQQWCTVARQAARTQAAGSEPHFDQVHWSQGVLSFWWVFKPQNRIDHDRTA